MAAIRRPETPALGVSFTGKGRKMVLKIKT
jgi:hypothetical protein